MTHPGARAGQLIVGIECHWSLCRTVVKMRDGDTRHSNRGLVSAISTMA